MHVELGLAAKCHSLKQLRGVDMNFGMLDGVLDGLGIYTWRNMVLPYVVKLAQSWAGLPFNC